MPAKQEIQRITLSNKNMMQVTLCNFGARILSIKVPNSAGRLFETTLNHQHDHEIINDVFYMGATCGRVSNRIAGAKFILNNKEYTVDANEGYNQLHGGSVSFSHRFWSMSQSEDMYSVTFTLISADGDQGFPGNLTATVTYTLDEENTLSIDYAAISDKLCPINLCNHSYFHLGEKNINDLLLQVNASDYLPIDEHNIPLGEYAPVQDIFDFTAARKLNAKLAIRDFDECFVVNNSHNARLVSQKNALCLDVFSDQLGLQVYTGNYLPIKHSAIALEAQGLIDAVNQQNFVADYVGPEQEYSKTVQYKFSAI